MHPVRKHWHKGCCKCDNRQCPIFDASGAPVALQCSADACFCICVFVPFIVFVRAHRPSCLGPRGEVFSFSQSAGQWIDESITSFMASRNSSLTSVIGVVDANSSHSFCTTHSQW